MPSIWEGTSVPKHGLAYFQLMGQAFRRFWPDIWRGKASWLPALATATSAGLFCSNRQIAQTLQPLGIVEATAGVAFLGLLLVVLSLRIEGTRVDAGPWWFTVWFGGMVSALLALLGAIQVVLGGLLALAPLGTLQDGLVDDAGWWASIFRVFYALGLLFGIQALVEVFSVLSSLVVEKIGIGSEK